MDTSTLPLYAYSDFRLLLKDRYLELKRASPKFSHRYIAGKVGATSSGWFADILKGRMKLTGTTLLALARLFGLEGQEAAFFEALVQYNQADSLEEKNHRFRKLLDFKEWQADLVGREKFEYYTQWYHSAIRELLFFKDFAGDFKALGKMLRPSITPAQARDSIQLLLRLGFLKKDARNSLKPQEATLRKDPAFKSLYAANYLKANMELGMQALEQVPREQRHISAMTLPLSGPAFEMALAEIEALRKKLLLLTEEDAVPDKVYQMNLQFFPLTH